MIVEMPDMQLQNLSPEAQAEYRSKVRNTKWCHRSFNNHLLAIPGPPRPVLSGTPDGGVSVQVQVFPGTHLCAQEECMMWDIKRRRCLDRSAAIATAYGKDEAAGQES